MTGNNPAEEILQRAASEARLTQDEVLRVQRFLSIVHGLGIIGKALLWMVITIGAVAAAIQQTRESGWF
jgi:hypothetical protein